MENRYLYRAKRTDNGEWVEGYYAVIGEKVVIIEKRGEEFYDIEGEKKSHGNKITEVDPSTICQCTGLRDKTGKLIWENDVVNLKNGKGVVIWDKAEWRIKWIKDTIWRKDLHFWVNEDDWKCEVIGNIFDNPELLEA